MKFRSEKIRELRKMHKYSLTMASRLLAVRCSYQVSRTTLWEWEKGKSYPGIQGLIALCCLYEVEPNYFFD